MWTAWDHQYIISMIIYWMDVHVIQISYEYIMTEDGRLIIALRQNPATSARWANRHYEYCCVSYMNAVFLILFFNCNGKEHICRVNLTYRGFEALLICSSYNTCLAQQLQLGLLLGHAFSELVMPMKSFILQDPSGFCRSQTGILHIDMITITHAFWWSLMVALTSTRPWGMHYCFSFTMVTRVRGSFRGIHLFFSTVAAITLQAKPKTQCGGYSNCQVYRFQLYSPGWGKGHWVGAFTHWVHQEPYFSQDSIVPGSPKPPL